MPQDNSIVQTNFQTWNNALQTLDAHKVAELYADDASFLPTLDGNLRSAGDETVEYFEHFLQKHPLAKIVEEDIYWSNDNNYLHDGLYNFDLGPENDRTTTEARFTYFWVKDSDGNWKIRHHHSSLKPKK